MQKLQFKKFYTQFLNSMWNINFPHAFLFIRCRKGNFKFVKNGHSYVVRSEN